MANELTIGASLRFKKTSKEADLSFAGIKISVTGGDYVQSTQIATTSAVVLNKGSIGTVGYIIVKNNDPTNFVSLRNGAAGADLVRLMPGEVAMFRASAQPWCIADTASCEIEYLMIEA